MVALYWAPGVQLGHPKGSAHKTMHHCFITVMWPLRLHASGRAADHDLLLMFCFRVQTLQSMGVTTAFSDKAADFSRISEDPLFVTSVLQSVSGCAGLCHTVNSWWFAVHAAVLSVLMNGAPSGCKPSTVTNSRVLQPDSTVGCTPVLPRQSMSLRTGNKLMMLYVYPMQAVVQVDETGTEAAAVTSLVMTTTSFRPDSTPPLVSSTSTAC
jgi:hypothetical protein